MDMIGKIRRLHRRKNKSEREIAVPRQFVHPGMQGKTFVCEWPSHLDNGFPRSRRGFHTSVRRGGNSIAD